MGPSCSSVSPGPDQSTYTASSAAHTSQYISEADISRTSAVAASDDVTTNMDAKFSEDTELLLDKADTAVFSEMAEVEGSEGLRSTFDSLEGVNDMVTNLKEVPFTELGKNFLLHRQYISFVSIPLALFQNYNYILYSILGDHKSYVLQLFC